MGIVYKLGQGEMLDAIEELWVKLNRHHHDNSPYFKHEYEIFTFAIRKKMLVDKLIEGSIHIDLAVDDNSGQSVAYCVSTVNDDKSGEIESLYVEAAYRRMGIGSELMKRALAWMDEQGAKERTLMVAVGNEAAFGFYSRYGFFPRFTMLKQTEPVSG